VVKLEEAKRKIGVQVMPMALGEEPRALGEDVDSAFEDAVRAPGEPLVLSEDAD
jgi:hypothetical protein